MNHPTSKAVFEVVERFKSVLPFAKSRRNLDFTTTAIDTKAECGTICCHGGWYLFSQNPKSDSTFELGIVKINNDLGFKRISWSMNLQSDTPVLKWASLNSEIWGNRNGAFMFRGDGESAFVSDNRPEGAQTLQDIIDHWTEVGERLLALEKLQHPEYKNISSELAILPIEETPDKIISVKEKIVLVNKNES